MDSEQILQNILDNSNIDTLENASDFIRGYIKKLILDIILYVDSNINLGTIELVDSYSIENELSQEITGLPSAYSAIDGDEKVLTSFAESYSHLGIAEYDSLCKEALLDFLNLHNGLFIVYLSEENICELSLSVPKQNGNKKLLSPYKGKITVIPVNFSFGTAKFLLLELQ